MVKFCRNCGKELAHSSDQTCTSCRASSTKATAFCRFCGHQTTAGDATCVHCGSPIKPLPASARIWSEKTKKQKKASKTFNLTLVIAGVIAYIILALPPAVTKTVKTATSDAVLASTGYTALPLNSIVSFPPMIPRKDPGPTLMLLEEQGTMISGTPVDPASLIFAPNDTRQLTIDALYKNINSGNAGNGLLEDITSNSTYKSNNDKVATVTAGGLVQAVDAGTTTIAVSYTAAPGSANISDSSKGKMPITLTTSVVVIVTKLPASLGGAP